MLFIRESSGIRLTELGLRLLRYCQLKESFEAEFMTEIQQGLRESLSGIVRLAGFSTVTKSVLIPVIGMLTRQYPGLRVDIKSQELRELPHLLESGQADFILTTRPLDKQGVENYLLGHEENVLVQAKGNRNRQHIYLDHDEEDTTTIEFFKIQKSPPKKYQRCFMDEIYLIIEAARVGIGRAVVPMHIVRNIKGLDIVREYKSLRIPVYLSYYTQNQYTRMQEEVLAIMKANIPDILK